VAGGRTGDVGGWKRGSMEAWKRGGSTLLDSSFVSNEVSSCQVVITKVFRVFTSIFNLYKIVDII
jgi:hypothetical protein